MSEWIGARYKYPTLFREGGENIQPDIVFWMVIPSRMITTTLIDPRRPVSFADSFEEAMQPAGAGVLQRPTSIRVPDDKLAKELRRVAGGIPVIVAPVPELDAAFAELVEMIGGKAAEPSYLDGGDIPEEVVAEFFEAAQSLFKTAPWRIVAEHQTIGVDIPGLKVKGACLSVIGGIEESFGLLLFRSLDDYLAFGKRPVKGGRTKDRVAMRSMSFNSRKEMPPSILREIKTHRWKVAGAKAYPMLFCVDKNMQPLPVTERDFRIMTACSSAFLVFLADHRDVFNAERPAVVKASFLDETGLMVIFTAPY
jgi:hypothetical protein